MGTLPIHFPENLPTKNKTHLLSVFDMKQNEPILELSTLYPIQILLTKNQTHISQPVKIELGQVIPWQKPVAVAGAAAMDHQ